MMTLIEIPHLKPKTTSAPLAADSPIVGTTTGDRLHSINLERIEVRMMMIEGVALAGHVGELVGTGVCLAVLVYV